MKSRKKKSCMGCVALVKQDMPMQWNSGCNMGYMNEVKDVGYALPVPVPLQNCTKFLTLKQLKTFHVNHQRSKRMTKIFIREIDACCGLNPCPYHNGFGRCLCEKTDKHIPDCANSIPRWCPLPDKEVKESD